ncbi:hypothetical protein FB451DRAFT_1391497 [Mycena latifolia]|nr:hypothetical protein FB451DRAFT_1391497 [Mycena latifolia]
MSDIIDASYPFSPTSDELNPPDVIIRSSDMVDFYAHRAILSFGSVVFKDMFSFPEPTGEDANPTRDGKSIITLPESKETVEKLLILCYPRFTSTYLFRDLGGVDGAYEAAGKYQIPDPVFLVKEPHRVFAIACHRGLDEVAKAAALETLKKPSYVPHLDVPEFRSISAHQLWKLQDFRSQCSLAIIALLDDLLEPLDLTVEDAEAHPPYNAVWWSYSGHSADCGGAEEDVSTFVIPAKWFRDHVERVGAASALHPHAHSIRDAMARFLGLH